MVQKQAIVSPIFATRNKLSPTLLSSFLVRGSGIQVGDSLKRFGWDGSQAVATVIVNLNPSSGMVSGLRMETRGAGPEVTFCARDLWEEAPNDVAVAIKFSDLSDVKWNTRGDNRNKSVWLDSTDLDVTYTKPDGTMLVHREELEAANINGFTVRLTLLPLQVDKMVLYGGILPLKRNYLASLVEEARTEMDSPQIPTIALKLSYSRGVAQNGFPVCLLPTKRPDDRVGWGHLPLLEAVGSADPRLPESDDVEEQLCTFMRKVSPTNNVSKQRLGNMLTPGSLPTSTTGMILYSWPEYRGPLTPGSSRINKGV